MAKITLNTNLADSTYTVEYKSIDVDINKNVSIKSTDLSIIPINNRVIDPDGDGNTASFISVPTTVAYQSCPAFDIPHSLSSHVVRNLVS